MQICLSKRLIITNSFLRPTRIFLAHMMRMNKAEALKQLVMGSADWHVESSRASRNITWTRLVFQKPNASLFRRNRNSKQPTRMLLKPPLANAGRPAQIAKRCSGPAIQIDRDGSISAQENAADRQARMEEKKLEIARAIAVHPLAMPILLTKNKRWAQIPTLIKDHHLHERTR